MSSVKAEVAQAQRKILQGVFVVTTALDGKVNGMTAAWVMRASFSPPLITVSIGKTRYTHELIMGSRVFAVNVLGPEHIETGKHFGLKTGRKTDKFAGIEYATKATGSPILLDCVSWMDCMVVDFVEAGDHTVFVGEVVDAGVVRPDGSPLVYDRDSFYK